MDIRVGIMLTIQIIHRDHRPHDRPKHQSQYQSRLVNQLLHHIIILVGPEPGSLDGDAEYRRRDEEIHRGGRNICVVGRGERHRYVALPDSRIHSFILTDRMGIGPQVFLDRDAPRYFIAFGVHLGCYSAMTLSVIFLRFYLKRENQRKDRAMAEMGMALEGEDHLARAFEDRTDRENVYFRYIY